MKSAVYVLCQSNYRVRHHFHAVIVNSTFNVFLTGALYLLLVQCVRVTSRISCSRGKESELKERKLLLMMKLLLNMMMRGMTMRMKKYNPMNVLFAVKAVSKTITPQCSANAEIAYIYSVSVVRLE